MVNLRNCAIVLLIFLTCALYAAPDTEWMIHKTEDGAHPSANEQQMMWLMNRARTNPIEEGKWLAGDTLPLPGNVALAVSSIPINTTQLKSEFREISSKAPSAFNRLLYEASKGHSDFMIADNRQSHDGQIDKINASGFAKNGGTVSVFWRAQDSIHGHAALNIDWGFPGFIDEFGMQPGRGHRNAIMASNGNWTNVGLAMVEDNDANTTAGPQVTSIAYYNAQSFAPDHYNRFVVGTIWTDTNGNSQYDPGEGHGGVTLMPDIGKFSATTADSGGFAIPATEEGTYNITISGGAITEPQQRTVQVSNQSVLMLWNEVDKWPDPPTAEPPLLQVARNGDNQFSFEVKNGQSYQLRKTTDLTLFQNDERTLTANGATRSFEVTQGDIDTGTFFDVLVTVDE